MNIQRIIQSPAFFFHHVMEATSKKNYFIVAIALAAIGSLALTAVCCRRHFKSKSINLKKDDKQQSKPIHGVTPIAQKVNQPVAKSKAFSPQQFAEKEHSSTPSGLSVAFPSPQELRTASSSESSPVTSEDSPEVVQLKNLLLELNSFVDFQNPKTPRRNQLRSMMARLEEMRVKDTAAEVSVKDATYRVSELSSWQNDHTYIIKHDFIDSIALSFYEPDMDMELPAPKLLDLIPSEISGTYDHENDPHQQEAMVNQAIDYYKKVKERETLILSQIKEQVYDLKEEMRNIENEARMDCFALMRSISNEYGAHLSGFFIRARGNHDSICWNPVSNKISIAKGFAFKEIDSPENLTDNKDDFYDDPKIVYYTISLDILDSLIWELRSAVESRIRDISYQIDL